MSGGIEARLVAAGWQPIATAPRDDESDPFILFNGQKVTVGSPWEGGWSDWLFDWIDPQPTHWMPLPTNPMGASL